MSIMARRQVREMISQRDLFFETDCVDEIDEIFLNMDRYTNIIDMENNILLVHSNHKV